MTTNLLLCVIASMVTTAICDFSKPAYKKLKAANTITILLSFILGIVASYAIYPYINVELTNGAIILIGLAIGTGSQIFYDLIRLLKNRGATTKGLDLD